MKYLSRGILLDIILICTFLTNVLVGSVIPNYEILTPTFELGSILIGYGALVIIFYLFKPETIDGESKVSYLLFGVLFLALSPLVLVLPDVVTPYYVYAITFIYVIHGLGRIFENNKKGLIVKIIQIIWSLILIFIGIYSTGKILNIEFINKIFEFTYFLPIIVGVDIIVLIVSIVAPRTDLENKSVKIDYSSHEDQISFKNNRKDYHIEEIDLNRLFKNKD